MTAAFARRSPAAVLAALATVYLVWGSTYLAMRITDRSMPPLLMSSARFLVAGTVLYALTARGYRPALREWVAAAIAGTALLVIGNVGVAWAETRRDSGQVHARAFTAEPLLAFGYLVVFGSLLAFSAYAWLLKNVRISTVATYAFVNPVVAVALGALFLGEVITLTTVVAGAA